MEIITRLVVLNDTTIAWSESCEIGEVVYVATRAFTATAKNTWAVIRQDLSGDTVVNEEREGLWLTHDIAERLDGMAARATRCSCETCFDLAYEEALDEAALRVFLAARNA